MRHLLTELGQSLRRNVSMHIAVVLTLFVSLSLVGLGVIAQKEADKTIDYLGSELQITVWLCKADDDRPACLGEVTEAQQNTIEKTIADNPEVAAYEFESQQVAFDKAKELIGPEKFEGDNAPVTVEDLRSSYRVTLKDPDEFEGITSAVEGLDGVSYLNDLRDELAPIFLGIDYIKYGSLAFAALLVLAALLLVANTVRLAALARRKEIGIMRLVGASGLYISLPFLLEALVMAALGVVLSGGALAAFMHFGILEGAADRLSFLPWVGWGDYSSMLFGFWKLGPLPLPGIVILGPILTLLPTLLLTRKYSKV
ncbi:MAG: permease-like cell division protein FtsX [Actinomycetota bacterium]|nr:permease-like cell division protein FtsX [Actinomycetota bacterium]